MIKLGLKSKISFNKIAQVLIFNPRRILYFTDEKKINNR